MNKNMKRWLAALLAVVVVGSMCYLSFDFKLTASEGDGDTSAAQQQQAVEEASKPVEVVVPAKPAEEKQEEPAQETTPAAEAPVQEAAAPAEEAAQPAAEPAAEAAVVSEEAEEAAETAAAETEATETEATAEEAAQEEPAAPAEENAEAPAAEPAEQPAEETAADSAEEPAEETAPAEEAEETEISVEVRLTNKGDLYYGETAELEAVVDGAEVYTIQWQYNDGEGWKDISGATGEKYEFTLDEENAEYEYRALVITE